MHTGQPFQSCLMPLAHPPQCPPPPHLQVPQQCHTVMCNLLEVNPTRIPHVQCGYDSSPFLQPAECEGSSGKHSGTGSCPKDFAFSSSQTIHPKWWLRLEKSVTALGEVTINPGSSAEASGNNLWQLWEGRKTLMIFILKIAGVFLFSFLCWCFFPSVHTLPTARGNSNFPYRTISSKCNSSLFWEPRNPAVGKQGNIFLPLLYSFISFIKVFPFVLLLIM